jgi:two-component system CheB/CheR fusion protein
MAHRPVLLVVEDEPLVKDSLALELEDAGFEVIAAESGDEASYILPRMRRIDLLLTDIRMPGKINGWALADMARSRRPNLPVIYTSGFSPQQGRDVEGGIFLPKPYRIGEILNAIEELMSGNAKISSINEELSSANEELEVSKEKLQSLNEELRTVNAGLKERVAELSRTNSDIINLLKSTRFATVCLDQKLTIKHFTPAARDLFYLAESDVGRPISQIRSRLRLDSVQKDAKRVLRTLAAVEAQIESDDGAKRYLMRILPYRALGNVIAGVVITFVDVTPVTAAEAEIFSLVRDLRNRVETMERILDLLPAGVFIAGNDPMQQVQVNRYGIRLLGEKGDQKGPRDVPVPYRLFDHDRELAFWEQPLQRAALTGRAVPAIEGRLVRRDGRSVDVMMAAEPLFDELGAPLGAIAAFIDMSEREGAEKSADGPASSERASGLSRARPDQMGSSDRKGIA